MTKPNQSSLPYGFLASIYDQIMEEIDYDYWADYLDGIIQEFHPSTITILELGGGTGILAQSLDELDCYQILCTDLSEEMITVASQKSGPDRPLSYNVLNAIDFQVEQKFDCVLCVFDSLNYLTSLDEVKSCFQSVHNALNLNGIWLFDFVTSKHCLENARDFAFEESFYDQYRVVREAIFPIEKHLHQTKFRVYEGANSLECIAQEIHLQKPFTFKKIESLLIECGFGIEGSFSDFSDRPPGPESKRITIVARCLKKM